MTSVLVQQLLRRSRRPSSLSFLLHPGRFHTSSAQQSTRRKQPPAEKPVPNKLESFLAQIESTKHHVSLQDVEKFKPRKMPTLDTPEYEAAYNELTSALFRSFSRDQFLLFFRDAGFVLPRRKTKTALVAAFIQKKWQWLPVSKDNKEKKTLTEVVEHNFPMTTEQSFLLMGKDGSNLLRISQQYNVHLAFAYNPLSLKVEGLKPSLDKCKSYMEKFYLDIHHQSVNTNSGTNISTEMLLDIAQSVSRATGAYVSVEQDKSCKITYLQSNLTALEDARFLLQKQLIQTYHTSLLASVQNSDVDEDSFISSSSYSLYPFSSSHPLPWQARNKSAFRLRRVGQWLPTRQSSHLEPIDLAQASSSSRRVMDVKSELLSSFNVNHKPQIFVSPGHILFLSPTPLASRLVPPLKGSVDFSTALRWSDNNPGSTIFLHSSPVSPFPGGTERSGTLKAVYMPQATSELQEKPSISTPIQSLIFETAAESGDVSVKSRTQCFADLLLPDRAYDLRLVASHEEAAGIPNSVLDAVVTRMKDNQRPLLSFEHDNTTYILSDYLNTNRQLDGPRAISTHLQTIDSLNTEEVVDITTGHKYITSEIVCREPTDENNWSKFLTDCAYVTRTT